MCSSDSLLYLALNSVEEILAEDDLRLPDDCTQAGITQYIDDASA